MTQITLPTQVAIETPAPTEMTTKQLEHLLKNRRCQEKDAAAQRRAAYESLRADLVSRIETRVRETVAKVQDLFTFTVEETDAFRSIMAEYGALRSDKQMSFTLQSERFKVEVKSSKIKKFDERADLAATRLIEFLRAWITGSERGANDPMYQLAMTLLERNKYGDLDYKSVSKLYDLEAQFNDAEYSAIMQLFKESNVIEGSAVNYYFYEKSELGVWRKVEPSFNRL